MDEHKRTLKEMRAVRQALKEMLADEPSYRGLLVKQAAESATDQALDTLAKVLAAQVRGRGQRMALVGAREALMMVGLLLVEDEHRRALRRERGL